MMGYVLYFHFTSPLISRFLVDERLHRIQGTISLAIAIIFETHHLVPICDLAWNSCLQV